MKRKDNYKKSKRENRMKMNKMKPFKKEKKN